MNRLEKLAAVAYAAMATPAEVAELLRRLEVRRGR